MAVTRKQQKIGIGIIIFLVGLAIVGEIIGFIPFAGDIITPIFWAIAGIIFWRKGYGIFNGKKLAASGVSILAGMIPVVQELPIELPLGIIVVIFILKAEYKTGLSLRGKTGGINVKGTQLIQNSVRRPNPTPPPLNAGGIRQPNIQPNQPSNIIPFPIGDQDADTDGEEGDEQEELDLAA